MLYNYEITTSMGEGHGSIEAKDEAEARKILAENHSGKFVDDKGQEHSNQITELTLELAG